jgi:ParB family transcriptional regulator, chromosome partitioning protein
MTRRTGLGRGLDALIPGGETPPPAGVTQIPIDQIDPNPRQPRSHFDADELDELAASIRQYGVIQPLILAHSPQAGRYLLIAGERRLMAARQAGLLIVPAILREASDQQHLELALIENIQRADLSPLEQADAYRQLAEEFNLSHEEISERVGKSRSAVTNTLRLLKLPASVQKALSEGLISEGHARALLALASPAAQGAALHSILKNNLNVRQTEELVRRLSGQKPPARPRPEPSAEIQALEERLRSALGTRVSLNPRRKGGTITIHYYSDEELNTLLDALLGDSA